MLLYQDGYQQGPLGKIAERYGPVPERPLLRNPDGSFSSEETITIQHGDSWVNIPTIWRGMRLSPEEAEKAYLLGHNPAVGKYRTVAEAEQSAAKRSEQLGKLRLPTKADAMQKAIADKRREQMTHYRSQTAPAAVESPSLESMLQQFLSTRSDPAWYRQQFRDQRGRIEGALASGAGPKTRALLGLPEPDPNASYGLAVDALDTIVPFGPMAGMVAWHGSPHKMKAPAASANLSSRKNVEYVSIKELKKIRQQDRRIEEKSPDALDVPTKKQLKRLTNAFRSGEPIEMPIEVTYDRARNAVQVSDGNTRLAALEDAGFEYAPVIIMRGELPFGGNNPIQSLSLERYLKRQPLPSDLGFDTLKP